MKKQNSKDHYNPYPSNFPDRSDMHLEAENIADSYRNRINLSRITEHFNCINNRYSSVNTSYESSAIPLHIFM